MKFDNNFELWIDGLPIEGGPVKTLIQKTGHSEDLIWYKKSTDVQFLDYVYTDRSDRSEYGPAIDTGIYPTDDTVIEVDMVTLNNNSNGILGTDNFKLQKVSNVPYIYAYSTGIPAQSSTMQNGERNVWEFGNYYLKKDGVTILQTEPIEVPSDATISLFACNYQNWQWIRDGEYRIYSCKIWQDGQVVADLVPAKMANTVGLFDHVSGQLLANCTSYSNIYAGPLL